MEKTRACLWITIVFVAIGFFVSTCFNLFSCLPFWRNWTVLEEDLCEGGWTSLTGNVVNYVSHIGSDLMSMFLFYIMLWFKYIRVSNMLMVQSLIQFTVCPFPLFSVLGYLYVKKLQVLFIFAIGYLTIVFGVSVIVVSWTSTNITANWLCAIFEETWAISLVCLPAFKHFLKSKGWRNSKKAALKASITTSARPSVGYLQRSQAYASRHSSDDPMLVLDQNYVKNLHFSSQSSEDPV